MASVPQVLARSGWDIANAKGPTAGGVPVYFNTALVRGSGGLVATAQTLRRYARRQLIRRNMAVGHPELSERLPRPQTMDVEALWAANPMPLV